MSTTPAETRAPRVESLTGLRWRAAIVAFTDHMTIFAVAARDMRGGRSILRAKVLVVLGDPSYAFYLVHATVVYLLLLVLGERPTGWANLGWYAVVLMIAVAVAAATPIPASDEVDA